MSSGISWTDEMWSIVTGCTKVSPACDHCYALTLSATKLAKIGHYQGVAERTGAGPEWTGLVRTHPDRLDIPSHWRKPRRVFVAGMADLFHPDVPTEFVLDTWEAMSRAPRHQFQVLTKRPQRMAAFAWGLAMQSVWPLLNVWAGTTIESDAYVWRANHLRATPSAVRWLSLEPLLDPLPSLDLTGIDWIVIGGESGPGRRPMELAWLTDVVARADAIGAKVFVKQDAHARPGQQGRIPDGLWARKEFPA